SSSSIRPVKNTSLNGTSPICSILENTILITQKNIISYPVTSTSVGKKYSSSLVFSGQPKVEKDHNSDENQVSKVSSSLDIFILLHLLHFSGFSLDTITSSQSLQ